MITLTVLVTRTTATITRSRRRAGAVTSVRAHEDGGGPGRAAATTMLARLADIAGTLEPPVLHTALLAAARLRATDPALVASLERAVLDELHRLHVQSLPAVVDSFAQLYESAGVPWGSSSNRGAEKVRPKLGVGRPKFGRNRLRRARAKTSKCGIGLVRLVFKAGAFL